MTETYNVYVNVEFSVQVEAEDREDAREQAEELVYRKLDGWDMPDHNLIETVVD